MKPLELLALTPEQLEAVATLYRTTHNVRLRTRAQMALLAAAQIDADKPQQAHQKRYGNS